MTSFVFFDTNLMALQFSEMKFNRFVDFYFFEEVLICLFFAG